MQTYIALVKLTDNGRVEIAESLKQWREWRWSRCRPTSPW